MKKDFWKWHGKKEVIDEKQGRVFFHEREIWFARLGANVGFEQDGKGENFGRPVLIFRKFNNDVFWGVPLTTREKGGKFYLPIELDDGLPRKAILSQLRLFDAKRLYQKLVTVDSETHKRLEAAIIRLAQGE